MLCSCTHMATVGVKGLKRTDLVQIQARLAVVLYHAAAGSALLSDDGATVHTTMTMIAGKPAVFTWLQVNRCARRGRRTDRRRRTRPMLTLPTVPMRRRSPRKNGRSGPRRPTSSCQSSVSLLTWPTSGASRISATRTAEVSTSHNSCTVRE